MNFFPALTTWQFAAAGLLGAAVPLVLHLLNRRRPRTVYWGAMEFVREALAQQRRRLQLRDVGLLILRMSAVTLLGLALAQPFFAVSGEPFRGRAPLHAVLLIDNSLSMSYQAVDGTLLERARRRAAEYIERLPPGSRISVIPACGAHRAHRTDPYPSKSQALDALESIRTVDGTLRITAAANAARQACRSLPGMAPRVVLFSDQQRANWTDVGTGEPLRDLPSLQIVDVSADFWWNASVAEVRLQDGLADSRTPATIVVVVQLHGTTDQRDLQLALSVDGRPIATQAVHFEPAQTTREVIFQHVFSGIAAEPGRTTHVALTASLNPDALPSDNHRAVVIPVVASLPVVFVDPEGGGRENRLEGRVGETRHLRSLLAPVTDRRRPGESLVEVRHLRLEQLDRETLADTRLVVMAGVADPEPAVPLLREFLLQGGRLLVAAGGTFDPAAWNRAAWRDGRGILPGPLADELLVAASGPQPSAAPFFLLDYESMRDRAEFQLAGNSETQLRDLYREPLFFRAVRVDDSRPVRDQLLAAEQQRVAEELELLDQLDQLAWAASRASSDAQDPLEPALEARLRSLRPDWLSWPADHMGGRPAMPGEPGERGEIARRYARRGLPRVLARFELPGRPPFLLERRLGHGKVLFVATGLASDWNTLPLSNAFVVFDSLLRREIRETLPARNFPASPRIALALPQLVSEPRIQLERPSSSELEFLDAGFLGPRRRGVVIERAWERGIYRVRTTPAADRAETPGPPSEIVLSVAGVPEESDLTPSTRREFEAQLTAVPVRWVAEGESLSLAGSRIRGEHLWRWLIAVVLILLAVEMVVVGRSPRGRRPAASPTFQRAGARAS